MVTVYSTFEVFPDPGVYWRGYPRACNPQGNLNPCSQQYSGVNMVQAAHKVTSWYFQNKLSTITLIDSIYIQCFQYQYQS